MFKLFKKITEIKLVLKFFMISNILTGLIMSPSTEPDFIQILSVDIRF